MGSGAQISWKKRGCGYLPPLPNATSKHRSPSTDLIDIHYSNLRISERWDWQRIQRLCSFLQVTEYELASLVLMPHEWVEKFKQRDQMPCAVAGGGRAVAMILTILEARVLKRLTKDVIVEPFPSLNKVAPTH